MAKRSLSYVCSECGADSAKWSGQCSACGAWNTLKEFREASLPASSSVQAIRAAAGYTGSSSAIVDLAEIEAESLIRIATGSGELDRVLGGGLVPGAVVLLGGNPGAGKSTLLLQMAARLAQDRKVLYVSGEESVQQLALRARRLSLASAGLKVMTETDMEQVAALVLAESPDLLIIDSIQVMTLAAVGSAAGSVSQVRECAALLTRMAKQQGFNVLMVGHVTKDGTLAGPKVLEHMVDTSLLLESAPDQRFRLLRAVKNRFGAVNELGVFAMAEQGMRDVANPSALFLSREEAPASGSVITILREGSRPLLIELQMLVDGASGQAPRRLAVGYDPQRLAMLLAVLHRHAGLQMADQDVFMNVAGGVRVNETAADLAVIAALISAFRNQAVPVHTAIMGEVGLAGEVRPVAAGVERVQEAIKHGFTSLIVPKGNRIPGLSDKVRVCPISHVRELPECLTSG